MKILVDGAALSRAVAHVVRMFDKDQPLIRLTAGDGGLVIEASGAESFSRAWWRVIWSSRTVWR